MFINQINKKNILFLQNMNLELYVEFDYKCLYALCM